MVAKLAAEKVIKIILIQVLREIGPFILKEGIIQTPHLYKGVIVP